MHCAAYNSHQTRIGSNHISGSAQTASVHLLHRTVILSQTHQGNIPFSKPPHTPTQTCSACKPQAKRVIQLLRCSTTSDKAQPGCKAKCSLMATSLRQLADNSLRLISHTVSVDTTARVVHNTQQRSHDTGVALYAVNRLTSKAQHTPCCCHLTPRSHDGGRSA
jgi:hypothetical protein